MNTETMVVKIHLPGRVFTIPEETRQEVCAGSIIWIGAAPHRVTGVDPDGTVHVIRKENDEEK